jgi:hypothetical protein
LTICIDRKEEPLPVLFNSLTEEDNAFKLLDDDEVDKDRLFELYVNIDTRSASNLLYAVSNKL